jgi:hypothetical protein
MHSFVNATTLRGLRLHPYAVNDFRGRLTSSAGIRDGDLFAAREDGFEKRRA